MMFCKHKWNYVFTYALTGWNARLNIQRHCGKCYSIESSAFKLCEADITKAIGQKKLAQLFNNTFDIMGLFKPKRKKKRKK
jgi:hypothetical protein